MNTLLLSLVNGMGDDLGQGGLVSVISIVLVFAILSIIIAITFGTGKIIEKQSSKTPSQPTVAQNPTNSANLVSANLDDEDAVVAALVASIDYRNEIKKDIKVISIKEIK